MTKLKPSSLRMDDRFCKNTSDKNYYGGGDTSVKLDAIMMPHKITIYIHNDTIILMAILSLLDILQGITA